MPPDEVEREPAPDRKEIAETLLDLLEEDLEAGVVVRRYDPGSDESMIDYAENELGVKLRDVPKVRDAFLEVVRAARERRIIRLALLGPRGGGKTRLAATIELLLYRWFGYDCQNVGGSLRQAQTCYEYVTDCHVASGDLAAHSVKITMSETRSINGDRIRVSAASETSVRGPHPKGSQGGGLLLLDERAIIPDRIGNAAMGQLSSADPSACVQLSTMGEDQVGWWFEMIEDADHKGYDLRSWTIFDVAKRCPYDCDSTCPVPEHFAEDYSDELGNLIHPAYCAGAAKEVDGWIGIDEIATLWNELDAATFERELLGVDTAAVGHVYDHRAIENCVVSSFSLSRLDDPEARAAQHAERFLAMDKGVGLDWGYAGETAACYLLRWREILVVYRWEFWSRVQYRKIKAHLVERTFEDRIPYVRCDGANPADNDELGEDLEARAIENRRRNGETLDPIVDGIAFTKWKDYGVGEVRRRLEKRLLLFPKEFGGRPVPGWEKAIRYLRAYRTDDRGKPVKEDDHAPDALLCGVLGWAPRFSRVPQIR